jgi:hypothetical protein
MTVMVAGLVVFGSALKPALKGRATAATSAVAQSASTRWLEWGMRSYHDYAFGLALIGFAVAAQPSAASRSRTVSPGSWAPPASPTWPRAGSWAPRASRSQTPNLIVAAWALSLAWMGWLVAARRKAA